MKTPWWLRRKKLTEYSQPVQDAYWRIKKAEALVAVPVLAAIVLGGVFQPWIQDPADHPVLAVMAGLFLAAFVLWGVSFARLVQYLRLVRDENQP